MVKAISMLVSLCLCGEWTAGNRHGKGSKYTNIWGVKVEGGEGVAQRIARDLGFTYKGKMGALKGFYEFLREDHPDVGLRHSEDLTSRLVELDEVKWANQQKLVRRETHDQDLYLNTEEENMQKSMLEYIKNAQQEQNETRFGECKPFFSCISLPKNYSSYLRVYGQKNINLLGNFSTKPAPKRQLYGYSWVTTKSVDLLSQKLSAYLLEHKDPYWMKQWYLQDYRTEEMPVMDLNVVPVHKMGYTGKGVVVAVVDSGVEHDNPELIDSFIERLSYDTCKDKPGSWPVGKPHGTKCAGVIAMAADNGICGVGIAYGAKIVGLRAICPGNHAEYSTAKALMLHQDIVHIYSNSWSISGGGRHVYTLDHPEEEAYRLGATEGRNKTGVVIVRSAGNDKDKGDNCAVDPDINIIYSITIAGADQHGKPTYYSERCTAIFATAYTRSTGTEAIVAPELNKGCSTKFGGTSAACSQASAVFALVLEANKDLTYRDVMHLITMSAEVAPLANNEDTWYRNGRGFWVSNDFGFGLINAENMVNLALNWENVPELRECIYNVSPDYPLILTHKQGANVIFSTDACQGDDDEVNYLEHVKLTSDVRYGYRGDIVVSLRSPSKTISMLLEPRYKDGNYEGLGGWWSIITNHNWGENPRGEWRVHYRVTSSHSWLTGYVESLTIAFYGTKEKPAHYGNSSRHYAAFRLPDGQTDY